MGNLIRSPSSTNARPTSTGSASWRKKKCGWLPVIWRRTSGCGSSKSSGMRAPRHGAASPSYCTYASDHPHAPTCSIMCPMLPTTLHVSLLMCSHSWIASVRVSRRRIRRTVNASWQYAFRQQHGDSYHAGGCNLWRSPAVNALLRCGYRRQCEDSWRGTPQGSCVQQSNLPYSLPLTISTYRRRRQPSSSRRPLQPPPRRLPLLLSPIRRHGQHPP